MATAYTLTQSDINNMLAKGVTLTASGLDVGAGDSLTTDDTLIATCAAGKIFFVPPVNQWGPYPTSSVNFKGFDSSEGEDTYISFALSADMKTATLKPPVGRTYSEFNVDTHTDAANAPLEWLTHPSAANVGDTVSFMWKGGTMGTPAQYNVIVYESDGTTIKDDVTTAQATPSYNFIASPAGTYTIKVYDKGGKSDATANVITQTITVSEVPTKLLYTLTAIDIASLATNECDYRINGSVATEGAQLRLGDICVAKVTGNRKFYIEQTNPYITSIHHFVWDNVLGEMVNLNYAISDNNQTATFTVVDNSGGILAYGIDTFKVDTRIETPAVVGNNNVYRINSETLTIVNKERFSVIAGADSPYDYGQYILSVLQFPFDIPADIIGGSAAIQLADKTLTANGDKLLDDVIKVDLGTITVPNTHNNMLDFAGTQAIIHLPLAPSIVLDLNYVIGQTLQVYYLLDCYTGLATINITSDKLQGVISSTQVDIGVKVPYMANSYTAPENTGVIAGGQNGVKVPYIELISHNAILPDGFYTIPIVDESPLIGNTGFVRVEEINLNTLAIGAEKAEIMSMLTNGVIIK